MAALSDWKALIGEIRDIKDRESAPGFEDSPVLDRCELQLRKWRLIHKHVHGHPFRDRPRTCRREHWRAPPAPGPPRRGRAARWAEGSQSR